MMTADKLFSLAQEYVSETQPDTVEICAFLEWVYRKQGMQLDRMELLDELEGKYHGEKTHHTK